MVKYLSFVCAVSMSAPFIMAKPIKNSLAAPEKGKLTPAALDQIKDAADTGKASLTQSEYEDIVADPQKAKTDAQRVAGLSAREMILMVDKSGSMSNGDDNPTGSSSSHWTRWDSARIAAESLSELMLSLDQDGSVDLMFWEGDANRKLKHVEGQMTGCGDIQRMFKEHKPGGGTPLHLALEHIYQTKLQGLLQRGEPFTVVILTDGTPDDPTAVKQFFKKVIKENKLESDGRETLAAFSFVRMGDDTGATAFLQDLDDNLIAELGVTVDIVDTKEDNFLFGTGKYKGKEGVGPFALLWDALYD